MVLYTSKSIYTKRSNLILIFRKNEREAMNKGLAEALLTLQDGIAAPSPDEQAELQEYMNDLEMHIEQWVDSWYKIDVWGQGRGSTHASGHLIPMR